MPASWPVSVFLVMVEGVLEKRALLGNLSSPTTQQVPFRETS